MYLYLHPVLARVGKARKRDSGEETVRRRRYARWDWVM
ncbi:hypothetical protein BN1221_05002c [Brenneria goodwinii]|uniref:Uncharacterized protein n=1 Tax=Brenneria goodwinii TaxID=1109412 RepID=A0A0G4K2Z0_9GAMM|nr:hypothetical protein BN1221_05002c [Brenneria goodwinii]